MRQHDKKNKAIFLDKDGTLVPDVPYNVNPAYILLQEGAGDALKMIQDQGFRIIVVTNQSGIAKGYFKEEEIKRVQSKLNELLSTYSVTIDGFYYCPHHPEGKLRELAVECTCRKPQAGLIRQATQDLNIDPKQSWIIGDTKADVEAGIEAGCQTIFFEKRYETFEEQFHNEEMRPDYVVRSWKEIQNVIINMSPPRERE